MRRSAASSSGAVSSATGFAPIHGNRSDTSAASAISRASRPIDSSKDTHRGPFALQYAHKVAQVSYPVVSPLQDVEASARTVVTKRTALFVATRLRAMYRSA